jgi:heavy metal efflux system protein
LVRMQMIEIPQTTSLEKNPSLGLVQQQVEVSGAEKKLEKSRMLPDLSIGYFSQTMLGTQEVNGISQDFGSGDRFNGIQAGIAIPIWFKPGIARTKSAEINRQISATNADYFALSLSASFNTLVGEYNKFKSSVDYYEQQAVPEAKIIIDQSTLSYKAGAMDYLDYVLSLDRALSIRQNYLDALNSYNQTIIELEFLTGKIF